MSAKAWLIADGRKPRLLDLFCGAGGAGTGYSRAGFEVVGVDIAAQPHYPFEFHQADALTFPLDGFDAIHASPPCQHYANVTKWRGDQGDHPDLIEPVRARLKAAGALWVIENVVTPAIRADFMLCGTAFGLPYRRHRHFETNWSGQRLSHPCQHRDTDFSFDHGSKQPESVYRDAIGCPWMTVRESREAIPPLYTEHIGAALFPLLRQPVAA